MSDALDYVPGGDDSARERHPDEYPRDHFGPWHREDSGHDSPPPEWEAQRERALDDEDEGYSWGPPPNPDHIPAHAVQGHPEVEPTHYDDYDPMSSENAPDDLDEWFSPYEDDLGER